MKYTFCFISLIVLSFLSCEAKGRPWPKKELKKYFDDSKVVELILAANKGDIKKIDRLIAEGADVNFKGKDDVTPLYAVFFSLNIQGFKRLLEHGADPNVPTVHGDSVIWLAATGGRFPDESLELLKLCLEHGGNPNWVFRWAKSTKFGVPFVRRHIDEGNTLLMAATLYNEKAIDAIKVLLDAGADINAINDENNTALSCAVPNRYDVAYFLLQSGADYNVERTTPEIAVRNRFLWEIENFSVNIWENGGKKELETQREYRRKVIAFLKEKGIEVHLKYPD